MTPTEFLAKLDRVRQRGEGWEARCPAHEDNKASLTVAEGSDGRVLVRCHAGCDVRQIVAKLGLQMRDLFPPREPKRERSRPQGKPEAIYVYTDASGAPLYRKLRFPGKGFSFERRAGDQWTPGLNGTGHVLYNLGKVLAADHGAPVFVVEGEKDVLTLERTCPTIIATTGDGGADNWRPAEAKVLEDRHVIVLPDNDEPGRKYARAIVDSLAGKARSLKVVELPGLGKSEDVTDWIGRGHTLDELAALIEATPEATHQAAGELEVLDLITVEPAPPRWLIGGILQEDHCAIIGGEPKTGKTWLALYVAICLAAGRDVLDRWRPRRAGRVLLYSPEGGPLLASNRLHQLCWGLQLDPADLGGRLLGIRGRLHVDQPADYQRLLAAIAKQRPDMLLLDPLISVHTAEENEANKLQPVLDAIRDLRSAHPGVAIVLVHHVAKSRDGRSHGYSLRGSSTLGGWYDTLVSVSLPDHQLGVRRVDVEHRGAPAPPPAGFTLQVGRGLADGLESVRLTACDPPEASRRPAGRGSKQAAEASERRQDLADLLKQAWTDKKTTSVRELAATLKVSEKTIRRYVEELESDGKVRRDGPAVTWTEE